MNQVLRVIIGGVAGAAIGFVLYKVIGCRTGACPLYGNPYLAMAIWGGSGGSYSLKNVIR